MSLGGEDLEGNQTWSGKFSASEKYKEVKEATDNLNKVFVDSVAKCVTYIAELKGGAQVSKHSFHFRF
jgi:hypothetical protein